MHVIILKNGRTIGPFNTNDEAINYYLNAPHSEIPVESLRHIAEIENPAGNDAPDEAALDVMRTCEVGPFWY